MKVTLGFKEAVTLFTYREDDQEDENWLDLKYELAKIIEKEVKPLIKTPDNNDNPEPLSGLHDWIELSWIWSGDETPELLAQEWDDFNS